MLVIAALGDLRWSRALTRVETAPAAVCVTGQPVAGTLLGVAPLGEAVTGFIAVDGRLLLAGL